jgi:hypothetical protein
MRFFAWWSGLPWGVRYGLAGLFILLSTVLFLVDVLWPWGWVLGILMFLFGGPSDSEKKGYHF